MIQNTLRKHRLGIRGIRALGLMALSLCLLAQAPAPAEKPAATPDEAPVTAPASTPAATAPPTSAAPATTPAGPSVPVTTMPGIPLDANAAIIPITGPIVPSTLDYLKFRLDASVENGATLIIIELDTPGGDLLTALEISKLLRTSQVPTLAWINTKAYSAGILIASACNSIVMAPTAAMGDCAPIRMGMGGLQSLEATERAKILSPLLAEFAENAQANGYDMAIFQAMCILDARVYLIRHLDTGETRHVNQDDYRVMVQGESVDSVTNQTSTTDRPIGMSKTLATPKERGKWELVSEEHDGKTLLVVNPTQAASMGLSKGQVATTSQMQQTLATKALSSMPITWAQTAGYWLTRNEIRALLIIILFVGAYIEMQAPGIGIGGFVSAVAMLMLIAGPLMVGLAEWWQVMLVGAGVIMLLIEIFAIPGFGLIGSAGLMAIFIGLTLMAVPTNTGAFQLPPSATAGKLQAAVLWMMLAIVVSGVAIIFLTRYFGSLPLISKLMLRESQLPWVGYGKSPAAASGSTGQSYLVQHDQHVSGDSVLAGGKIKAGDKGRAVDTLRPSGMAKIGEHVVDVISDGQWIEPGQKIRVIEARGSRILVESDDPQTPPAKA